MIDPAFARLMARYNCWQNERVYAAAATLGDAQRREDLGAFFGSIHRTLSHLAWGDATWMSRFTDWPKPPGTLSDSPDFIAGWDELLATRKALDAAIIAWAEHLSSATLSSSLSWYSGAAGRDVTMAMERIVVHFFNHQTHHRGQVNAMLTRCGAKPGDTDLFLMPD